MNLIDFNDVTSGVIDGSGIFDKIMSITKLHIIEEHESGRITGSEYAIAYMNNIQNSMSQSIEYVTKKQLIEAQISAAEKDIEVKVEQKKGLYAERILKDKQAALAGLDKVVKTSNSTPENVYTPKYEEIV